ncbi:MAG: hypothetical protein WCN95_11350 [bacterium]
MKKRNVITAIAICSVITLAVVLSLTVYTVRRARRNACRGACIGNLRCIEAAKDNYAIGYGATNGMQLKWDNLCIYMKGLSNFTYCPSAPPSMRSLTNYALNPVGVNPECRVVGAKGGHSPYIP